MSGAQTASTQPVLSDGASQEMSHPQRVWGHEVWRQQRSDRHTEYPQAIWLLYCIYSLLIEWYYLIFLWMDSSGLEKCNIGHLCRLEWNTLDDLNPYPWYKNTRCLNVCLNIIISFGQLGNNQMAHLPSNLELGLPLELLLNSSQLEPCPIWTLGAIKLMVEPICWCRTLKSVLAHRLRFKMYPAESLNGH